MVVVRKNISGEQGEQRLFDSSACRRWAVAPCAEKEPFFKVTLWLFRSHMVALAAAAVADTGEPRN